MLRIRLRKLPTKSLHLSVVRKKRLQWPLRCVRLNLSACPSFNTFIAICIDGCSFPQKEVVWTDQILYDTWNILIRLLIGALGASDFAG